MNRGRFVLTCASDEGEGAKACRGDLVLGFTLRDTASAARGMVTACQMVGTGRPLRKKDVACMLDALKSDPVINGEMLKQAVKDWIDEAESAE